MILDEVKIECINLLSEGINISEVARRIGKSRQAIYLWLADENFKAELDRTLQQIKTEGQQKIIAGLGKYISNIEYIANNSKSEKVKLDANAYLVDRVLGRPTSKVDMSNDNKETNEYIDPLDDIEDDEIINEQ